MIRHAPNFPKTPLYNVGCFFKFADDVRQGATVLQCSTKILYFVENCIQLTGYLAQVGR